MFPSNPFTQLAESTDGFSPNNSFLLHEKADVHYSYHQKCDGPFIAAEFLFHAYNSSAPHPVTENVATIKQDSFRQPQFSERSGFQHSEDHLELLDSVISRYTKKIVTSKKDGRSKIYTARGPRDRRVRLSIDISRKFFCLQDLLGFDKASKTLDWLFSKSKIAIKELVDDTTNNSSSKVTDQSKQTFLDTLNDGSFEDNAQKRKCVGKKRKASKAGVQDHLGRDLSRTEARARARERTREKLRVKKLDDDLKTLDPDSSESGFWGQTEQKYNYKDLTWESIMEQETWKQSKDSSI